MSGSIHFISYGIQLWDPCYKITDMFNSWGTGIARIAAKAVMQWAVVERGVRRFIAETERENSRSGRVLEKLGFTISGTDYCKYW